MNPVETIKGKITGWDESGRMSITAQYDNVELYMRRGYKDVEITLIDARPLSDKQRRMCYALLREIADWQGQDIETTKTERKLDFTINELERNGDKLLSFANAPVSVVRAFQRYLVEFIIVNDIPTKIPLWKYVDDIGDYVYRCLINKKCAVCGKYADLHHIDRVGIGRDREEIIHEGMEAMSLCRVHHTEAHTMGDTEFFKLYHFDGGIKIDRTICKIYNLKIQKP